MPGAKVRPTKGRRRVRPMSARRAAALLEYAKAKRQFLAANPKCQRVGCRHDSEDLHHIRGRVGALLTMQEFWKALCRRCHNWVGDHPKEARSEGLLCQPGEWNKVPR
jgi:hypothetical protein